MERAALRRAWRVGGCGAVTGVLLLIEVAGAGAQGLAPRRAETVSFEAQAAAAAAVAKEQADWGPGVRAEGDDGAGNGGDGKDGSRVIYSKDGTWTLPVTALTAGAACMPHCAGVCMEHCQFRANPATGLVDDTRPCSADCQRMCKQGCLDEPDAAEGGGGLADAAAEEASENASPGDKVGGKVGGGEIGGEKGGEEEEGRHAQKDGVGANDTADKSEIPLKDCIPVCLTECLPHCERASTKDPHICKGDCNSYCVRDCKLQQGTGGPAGGGKLPEESDGPMFEYMSVDDAVLPHQSPKMDSRDMGPTECEPHCNSECVDECRLKYHTPEKCPGECKRDCHNYCKPLYGTVDTVGDKLVQETERGRKTPLYSDDIEASHSHDHLKRSEEAEETQETEDLLYTHTALHKLV